MNWRSKVSFGWTELMAHGLVVKRMATTKTTSTAAMALCETTCMNTYMYRSIDVSVVECALPRPTSQQTFANSSDDKWSVKLCEWESVSTHTLMNTLSHVCVWVCVWMLVRPCRKRSTQLDGVKSKKDQWKWQSYVRRTRQPQNGYKKKRKQKKNESRTLEHTRLGINNSLSLSLALALSLAVRFTVLNFVCAGNNSFSFCYSLIRPQFDLVWFLVCGVRISCDSSNKQKKRKKREEKP